MSDKSDDLDHIPTIKPAQDEVTSYRRSQERRPEAPQQSSFNGTLVFVIVVLAVMMGLGGFTLYEVQQNLDQTSLLLTRSKEQITELQRRLSITDQDFAKSGSLVDSRLDETELEIRKLWDVANKRNKQWIKDNEAAVAKVGGQIDGLVKRVGGMGKTVDDMTASFAQLDSNVGRLASDLRTDNEELATQLSLVRGQVQDQTDGMNAMKRDLLVVDNRLKVIEEAITAIDQHRKQLSLDLAELTREIKAREAAPSP